MKGSLGSAILAAILIFSQSTEAEPRALTLQEATDLAMAAVSDWRNGSEHLPGFELEPSSYHDSKDHLSFDAMWRGACAECGSSLGHFVVNMNDADIYDPILFREIKSVSVQRLQIKLRKKMDLDHKSYVKFRKADKTICWNTVKNPDGPLVCPP